MTAILVNENVAQGLPAKGTFQAGISDFDPTGYQPESNILLPFPDQPEATWIYYDVILDNFLDSGIAVHRILPQTDTDWDTLASCDITDPGIDKLTGRWVNTSSNGKYSDFVQRMAHSRYWFNLRGQALRIVQKIPIPGIKTICGLTAIPHDDNPQRAMNRIVGNYSGYTLWHASWNLWYTVSEPPKNDQVPPQNLGVHIAGDADIPKGMQAPFSQPDDEAQNSQPTQLIFGQQG